MAARTILPFKSSLAQADRIVAIMETLSPGLSLTTALPFHLARLDRIESTIWPDPLPLDHGARTEIAFPS
jgi:hypothetical protein